MTPEFLVAAAIKPALWCLGGFMEPAVDTPMVTRFMTAIAIQESGLTARRQMGGGPARSFWQFEPGGVNGVLSHPRTRVQASRLCEILCYRLTGDEPANVVSIMTAIEHCDVLAAGFSRLNLWASSYNIPISEEEGWRAYFGIWRPGKPDRERWVGSWAQGQRVV